MKSAKKFRRFLAKRMVSEMGKDVNIERGAKFSRELKIGDKSGVGVNCKVYGDVTIGTDVMMGPECMIFTKNHEFSRTDIPMCEQGAQVVHAEP